MNFKQAIFLIYIAGFFLENFCIENAIAIQNTENTARRQKGNKKYIRNEHIKKNIESDIKPEGINDSDLEEVLNEMYSLDESKQGSLDRAAGDNTVSAFSKIRRVLHDPTIKNISVKDTDEMNLDQKNLSKNNDHSKHHETVKDTEKNDENNNSKSHIDTKNTGQVKENDKPEHTHVPMNKKSDSEHSKDQGKTNNRKDETTVHEIDDKLIDQLAELLLEKPVNDSTNEKGPNPMYDEINIGLSGDRKDEKHATDDITNPEDTNEEIDDIEPKIKKEIYYPLGKSRTNQFIQEIKETNKTNEDTNNNEMESSMSNTNVSNANRRDSYESQVEETQNSLESKLNSNSLNTKPKSINYENVPVKQSHLILLQKNEDMDTNVINGNSEEDSNEDDEEELEDTEEDEEDTEETEEDEAIHNIEEAKIKEDANLLSFDTEEDTYENNKNHKEDPSIHEEKKLIRNARKVHKLLLFDCNFIKNWDFTKEYIDEQGTLVKLSGYVFQNIANSDSMPTKNLTEWKLKGACNYNKYVCGALKYFNNLYQKGDRVIFNDKIYEALSDTIQSPKVDDGTWVEKTAECFDL